MPSKSQVPGNALYTINIPTHDPLGHQLVNLADHPDVDFSRLKRMVHDVHTEGPHEGYPYRQLKILAVDHPQVDAHVKSTASNIGSLSGHQAITIHKQGPNGIEPWSISNRLYNGGPADTSLHAQVAPGSAAVAPTSYLNHP